MDEENNKQNDSFLKKTGGKVKEGAKKQAKNIAKKIIKKIILAILPILLKVLIPVIIIVVLITAISNFLDKITGESSKEANAFAVQYDSSGEQYTSSHPNRIVVNSNNTTPNGAYQLSYEFETQDETAKPEDNEIPGQDETTNPDDDESEGEEDVPSPETNPGNTQDGILQKIKQDLLEQNEKLDLSTFSESELKIIGTLMYNGLFVEDFNEEELKALAVFVKVGIAGQSFDLRSAEQSATNISLDDIRDNDDVYGTIQVHRTKVEELSDGNVKYKDIKLQYIDYGDESTPGTFCYMAEKNDINIIDKFSVDEEGNLVIAKWGKVRTEYSYLDNGGQTLSSEDMEKILEEGNVREQLVEETNSIYIDKFEYKQNISKYVLTYGVLSDLLITTKNPEFCLELAEIALNSKIVININEELTSTVTTTTTDYTQTTLLYDYIKYDISGKKEETKDDETIYVDLAKEVQNPSSGELIKEDASKDYTEEEIFKYTIVTTETILSNTYDLEVSEIDCWYSKYNKEYEAPTKKETPPNTTTGEVTGEYPEEPETILETTDKTQIESDKHVQNFITSRKNKYKTDYPEAVEETIKCNVGYLKVNQKVKTDSQESSTKVTTTYEFGEEKADTTEVTFKNIEFADNVATFTSEGPTGFLQIYNQYRKDGVDLYLQDDSESKLFELLETDNTTAASSDVIKYFLYVYDGVDRGVTSLTLTVLDIDGLNTIKGSSTENFIKAWENHALWAYETNQVKSFPIGYLTEDEAYYIVYEDGSRGHNNIAYGWATYISDSDFSYVHEKYGNGYYNWKEEFETVGINVEDLCEGAYVDKQLADSVFENEILQYFINTVDTYLAEHLAEYEFSQAQKDALISICYQYGNISGFKEAYINSLDEEGNLDPIKLKTEYSRLNYSGTVNDREYANWLLFTEGIYIDRTGNQIVTKMSLHNWDGDVYSNNTHTFPVYNQYDERWGSYHYGGPNSSPNISENKGIQKNIGICGCGCCALASILSGYLGETITPDLLTQTLDDIYPNGDYYTPDKGSNWNLYANKVLKEFGCSGKDIESKSEALEALKAGYAVLGGEEGHLLTFVPVSSEDANKGYVFRIIDSARGHNVLCKDFSEADNVVDGDSTVIKIIYPPEN